MAKVMATVTGGAQARWEDQDEWQRQANGYTVALRYGGRSMRVDWWQGVALSGDPEAADVLYSVMLDASYVEGGATFEDFCGDLGYDTDSRRAERAFKACQSILADLRRLFRDDYDRIAEMAREERWTRRSDGVDRNGTSWVEVDDRVRA